MDDADTMTQQYIRAMALQHGPTVLARELASSLLAYAITVRSALTTIAVEGVGQVTVTPDPHLLRDPDDVRATTEDRGGVPAVAAPQLP